MKRQSRPVQVEHRSRRSAALPVEPRQPPRDSKIRAWRDDIPAPTPPLPLDKSEDILLQAEIEVHNGRMRLANDPNVLQEASEKLALRDQVERQAASIMPVPNHPLGKAYLVFARSDAAYPILGKGLRRLFPKLNFVSQPKHPGRAPWWTFVKDTRKDPK
jgi:hypothetical protein